MDFGLGTSKEKVEETGFQILKLIPGRLAINISNGPFSAWIESIPQGFSLDLGLGTSKEKAEVLVFKIFILIP